mmetsp:Transcript_34580/g.104342  ORF Transcript_34580/g.104342 Transcript_34580/m.104342 type:complete len:211 (-) Transcript_34580:462-1094(-)
MPSSSGRAGSTRGASSGRHRAWSMLLAEDGRWKLLRILSPTLSSGRSPPFAPPALSVFRGTAFSTTRTPQRTSSRTMPRLQMSAAIPLYSRFSSTSGAVKGRVPHLLRHMAFPGWMTARSKSVSLSTKGRSGESCTMKFSGLRSRWHTHGPRCMCATTLIAWEISATHLSNGRGRPALRPLCRWFKRRYRFSGPPNSMRKMRCVGEWYVW